ncbi:hypothetical protein [Flavobacterium sp.]|uniref:hypothetical protein n=1 Tax=Flavobacterium sp. TaxID=239 RepID=UPI003BC6827D
MKLILLTKKHCLNVFLIFFILFGLEGKAVTKTYLSLIAWGFIVWRPAITPVACYDLVFKARTKALPINIMTAISFNSVTINS